MGGRALSWENGGRRPSQLDCDEDFLPIDELPRLSLESLAFEREIGGRPALDDINHSVRRDEEDVRKLAVIDHSDKGKRSKAQKSNQDRVWTEVTKDLVSEEAIKEVGYDFEETEEFYYVMEYLRYEDVLRLVELTEDIRRDRRGRILGIQAEREFVEWPRRPLVIPQAQPPWDEERVVETEVIYDRAIRTRSRQEPWHPLSLHEGETSPITNLAPSHKISNENGPGHSDYFSTAASNDRYLADTRKPEIDVTNSATRGSVRRTLWPRRGPFFLKTPTTSARPASGALVQSAGSIKEASQIQPALGVSVDEPFQWFSTKEDREDVKLLERLRHLIPQSSCPTTEAPTTTGLSREQIDDRRVGTDQRECKDNAERTQDSRSSESSQPRTSTSDAAFSSQSEDSSASPSQSPHASFDLIIAQAKHELMVTLMKEVYAMFDSEWKLSARTCATSQQRSSGRQAQKSKLAARRDGENSKKHPKDRESSPPGDDNGKRRKRDDFEAGLQNQGRLFACPFYKYDPYKYSLNSDTGAAYRSCLGPGFTSISHVKQHLRRTHRAPIQCQRCWLVMPNLQEMGEHANAEPRCDRRVGQPEGAGQEKLDHIFSIRGPTWKKIYDILFPGAPIPSPYFEAQVQLPESFAPSSPATQELEEFEAYSRRALPRLVEANLQAMVNTEMVPLEENLRRLLVDIVRRCQSTVAENFRVTRPSRKVSPNSPQQPSSQAISPLPTGGEKFLADGQLLAPTVAGTTSGFFEEPPHVPVEAGPSYPKPPEGTDGLELPQNQFTDSGYGGSLEACDCICHVSFEIEDITNDATNCGDCIDKHFDIWNLSYGDLSRQSE